MQKLRVLFMVGLFCSASAATSKEDRARAVRKPSAEFRGSDFEEGASLLNARLLADSVSTKECELFTPEEIDEVVRLLEAAKDTTLYDTYVRRGDRRLRAADRVERAEWDESATLARERRCVHAVLLYVHHLSSEKRSELSELLPALPLLPRVARHVFGEGGVHRRYLETTDALQCHLEVVRGCPGGRLDLCEASCPEDVLKDRCLESCASLCDGNATDTTPLVEEPQEEENNSGVAAAARVAPPRWGMAWQAIVSRNSTNADGSDAGFRACARWYDWTLFAMRTDCSKNGVTTTSLHLKEYLYQISYAKETCFRSLLAVTPVSPEWLSEGDAATYLGQNVVNDIPVDVWDKPEPLGDGGQGNSHIISTAISDGRPVQMLTTGPTGEANQKDYVNYLVLELDAAIFAVPSFCRQGTAATHVPLALEV